MILKSPFWLRFFNLGLLYQCDALKPLSNGSYLDRGPSDQYYYLTADVI